MIATLLLVVLGAVIVMGLLAPYETLGWWGGWYGDEPDEAFTHAQATAKGDEDTSAKLFAVYLTGIGGTSPTEYSPFEVDFLREIKAMLPEVAFVDDVFPYSSGNRALTGQRAFGWFWRLLKASEGHGYLGAVSFLINLRNLWQVLVSSDRRFGPIYNTASAQMIYQKLLEHGYPIASPVPLTLIGYSGGGQISLGAALLLRRVINAPIHIISLAGVMSSSQTISQLESLTHLYGSKDHVQRLGFIAFPARWKLCFWTAWNRAVKDGVITYIPMGAMGHTGPGSYLDPYSQFEDGESFLTKTVTTMTGLITTHLEKDAEKAANSHITR